LQLALARSALSIPQQLPFCPSFWLGQQGSLSALAPSFQETPGTAAVSSRLLLEPHAVLLFTLPNPPITTTSTCATRVRTRHPDTHTTAFCPRAGTHALTIFRSSIPPTSTSASSSFQLSHPLCSLSRSGIKNAVTEILLPHAAPRSEYKHALVAVAFVCCPFLSSTFFLLLGK